MRRVAFFVEPEDYQAAVQMAARRQLQTGERVSAADIIREALKEKVKTVQQKKG